MHVRYLSRRSFQARYRSHHRHSDRKDSWQAWVGDPRGGKKGSAAKWLLVMVLLVIAGAATAWLVR